MSDTRSIEEFHRDRESGTGCPDDANGVHYFAFIDCGESGRVCIDCGAPEGEPKAPESGEQTA